MLPLRDDIPSSRFPIVNWTIILLNVLFFLWEISMPESALNRAVLTHGLVPARFLEYPSSAQFSTIFYSMFMHAGWLHLISNMWALGIFGDNIEDRLGHMRYLCFYLLCGVAAAMTQVFFNADATTPMVGASGAIAGILGAYILLFPQARVLTLIPIIIIPFFLWLPAVLYLGLWFFSQLFTGMFALAVSVSQQGGVAFWAHIGGFITGFVLVKLFDQGARPRWYPDQRWQLHS